MKELKVTIKVKDRLEAYSLLNEISFEHKVLSAEFDGAKEVFSKVNKPKYFLKDTEICGLSKEKKIQRLKDIHNNLKKKNG